MILKIELMIAWFDKLTPSVFQIVRLNLTAILLYSRPLVTITKTENLGCASCRRVVILILEVFKRSDCVPHQKHLIGRANTSEWM